MCFNTAVNIPEIFSAVQVKNTTSISQGEAETKLPIEMSLKIYSEIGRVKPFFSTETSEVVKQIGNSIIKW